MTDEERICQVYNVIRLDLIREFMRPDVPLKDKHNLVSFMVSGEKRVLRKIYRSRIKDFEQAGLL